MPTYHPLKLNSVNSRTLLFRKISAPLHQKHFIYNKDYLQSFLLLNFTSAELIVRNYCTDMFRKTSAKYFYYFQVKNVCQNCELVLWCKFNILSQNILIWKTWLRKLWKTWIEPKAICVDCSIGHFFKSLQFGRHNLKHLAYLEDSIQWIRYAKQQWGYVHICKLMSKNTYYYYF